MRKIIFFICFLCFFCTLELKPPIYKSTLENNLDTNWEIHFLNFGFLSKVKNHWWGDSYYQVIFSVKNKSDKYRLLNLDNYKIDDLYLDYTLSRKENLSSLYKSNPELFDIDELFNKKRPISLKQLLIEGKNVPSYTYAKKPVFPISKFNNKSVVSAILVAGDFGIPASGPVTYSKNATGWLAPGESTIMKVNFSILDNFPIYALVIPDLYESYLEENLMQDAK